MEEYIFVYQTINQINGKSYIGVHRTKNLNDGYIGCGVFKQSNANRHMSFHRAVRKYGYNNFRKYILDFFDSYEDALMEERFLVNIEWAKNDDNYNSAIGGEGSTTEWMTPERKREWKRRLSQSVASYMNNGGLEERRLSAKKAIIPKKMGSKNPSFGKPSVRRREILKFTKDGLLLKKFDCLLDAANEVNESPSNITACCKGRYLSCRGFVYRYKVYSPTEEAQFLININRGNKKDREERRINKIKKSFIEKGRKDSLKFKNIDTGEIIIGITYLMKNNNCSSFSTIKKIISKTGQYKCWQLINPEKLNICQH